MPGLEIAGVVLAVLPLIINQVDNYAKGLETLRLFRKQRYRREFNSYVIRLSTQQTLLRNTIQRLLEDVVQHENDLARLIMDPEGPMWESEALEKELRSKLDDNYDIFVANMAHLLELLQSLRQKLGLQPYEPSKKSSPEPTSSGSSMDLRQFRVIFSSSVYRDLLSRTETVNGHLQMLMEHAHHHQRSCRKRLADSSLSSYQAARRSARSLYNALTLGDCRKCVCRDQHTIYVRLQGDNDQDDRQKPEKKPEDLPNNETARFHLVLGSEIPPLRFIEAKSIIVAPSPEVGTGINTAARKMSKKVTFKVESSDPKPSIPASQEPVLSQIVDLCRSIASLTPQKPSHHALGFLLDRTQPTLQHKLYVTSTVSEGEGFQSLKALLSVQAPVQHSAQSDGVLQLSTRERLQLAANLARNIFIFHGFWLRPNWMTDDILIRPDSTRQARSLFLSLPLSQPRSQENSQCLPDLAPSANTLIQNKILFPLGLALTELSLCRTLADLQIPIDQDPIPTTSYFKTVSRCLQSVYDESGLRYGDAVRKCLFWSETRESDIDDTEFQSIVLNTIVQPILETVKTFEGR